MEWICDEVCGRYSQQIPLGQAHSREEGKLSKGSNIPDQGWSLGMGPGKWRKTPWVLFFHTPQTRGCGPQLQIQLHPIRKPETSCTAVWAVDCTIHRKQNENGTPEEHKVEALLQITRWVTFSSPSGSSSKAPCEVRPSLTPPPDFQSPLHPLILDSTYSPSSRYVSF